MPENNGWTSGVWRNLDTSDSFLPFRVSPRKVQKVLNSREQDEEAPPQADLL